MGHKNPWAVETIEAFSFYCCPECDFKSKKEDRFKRHAMESHNKSKVFFIMTKSENNTNNDSTEVETEPESQDENEDSMEDFIETLVKEESISEFEGEETVKSREHIAQNLIDRPDNITQEDLETSDESSDLIEDNPKIFDDKGLEDNVKELENFENITDVETSENETLDGIGEDLETFDEHNVEETKTFNEENFDNIREVEMFDKEDISESKQNIVSKSYSVETPKCPICEEEFTGANLRWNMKVHMKNIHKLKGFIPVGKKELETLKQFDLNDEPINTESKKAEFCLTKNGKQGIKFGGHIFVKDKKTYSRASKYRKRTHSGFTYCCSRLV